MQGRKGCGLEWVCGVCGSERVYFTGRRLHTRFTSDWSSDLCSSALLLVFVNARRRVLRVAFAAGGEWLRRPGIARLAAGTPCGAEGRFGAAATIPGRQPRRGLGAEPGGHLPELFAAAPPDLVVRRPGDVRPREPLPGPGQLLELGPRGGADRADLHHPLAAGVRRAADRKSTRLNSSHW